MRLDGFTRVAGLPVCNVYLKSDFVDGPVRLGVVDYIPAKGISLVLGNDLAGGRMWPCPVVTPCPVADNNTQELEQEYPNLFPACAVTRSMTEAAANNTDSDSQDVLTDVSLRDFFDSVCKTTVQANSDGIIPLKGKPITRDHLISEQRGDSDLQKYFQDLVEESDSES